MMANHRLLRLLELAQAGARTLLFAFSLLAAALPTNLQGPLGRLAASENEHQTTSDEVETTLCDSRNALPRRAPVAREDSLLLCLHELPSRPSVSRAAALRVAGILAHRNGCGAPLRC
jgi:hypothetical protein